MANNETKHTTSWRINAIRATKAIERVHAHLKHENTTRNIWGTIMAVDLTETRRQ